MGTNASHWPIALVVTPEMGTAHARQTAETMETPMKWVKPTIEEMCIGLEINDYFPAEF